MEQIQINCPHCGNTCEVEGEIANGQHLICPFCSEKFAYSCAGSADSSPTNATSATDVTEDSSRSKICINCPQCGAGYEVDASAIGETVQCGACNKDFVVAIRGGETADAVGDDVSRENNGSLKSLKHDGIESHKKLAARYWPRVKAFTLTAMKITVPFLKVLQKKIAMSFTEERRAGLLAMATNTRDKTFSLWKSGMKGKIILCMVPLVVISGVMLSCWSSGNSEKSIVTDKSNCQTVVSEGKPAVRSRATLPAQKDKPRVWRGDTDRGSLPDANSKISLGGEAYQRCMAIMKLSDAAVENGDTISFYGFFPGMSRHDAQFLAAFYNLDGNDYCSIAADGEKAVYNITLGIKSLAKILKVMKLKGQTFKEIGQEIANAVGDMQVTTKTDRLGYQSQWAERTLINGTHLVFTFEGLRISGNEDVKEQKPIETIEAHSERTKALETIISDILNNMVDIDVGVDKMKPFKIGKFEVTQRQWSYVMGKNPSAHMSEQIGRYNSGERPVDSVSWNDCQDFFKELNSLPEVKKMGMVFRLPTAEEWEYACRSRSIDGISILEDGRSVTKRNVEEIAWMEISDDCKPVGLKKPNAFGLYDMIGNVSEWTLTPDDDHEGSYVYLGGDGGMRWNDKSSEMLWREHANPTSESYTRGFRICASQQDVVVKRRKFSASYTNGEYVVSYKVCDGAATITGITLKDAEQCQGKGRRRNGRSQEQDDSGFRDLTVPSEVGEDRFPVRCIGDRAFEKCNGLGSITIPDSVTDIDNEAFYSCDGLKSVTTGNALGNIEPRTFAYMRNLVEVKLGNGVTNIGKGAFYECRKLSRLKFGDLVATIGEEAFYGCTAIQKLTIPDSVITIGRRAFDACSGLKTVTIGNSVRQLEAGAFGGLKNLEEVTIGSGVTNIGERAFYFCDTLSTVTLGNSVACIGDEAFGYCKELRSITIPNSVKCIGERAFDYCRGLANIELGSSVSVIGKDAFNNCDLLTRVALPDSLIALGEGAFSGCEGLSYVSMGNSTESIGDLAFGHCKKLLSVKFGRSIKKIGKGAFCECEGLTSVKLPNSTIELGERAFCQCKGLTTLEIGNSVEHIGKEAFEGCQGLTNVIIPDSVANIGDSAFSHCGLKSVQIGCGVKNIGEGAFSSCGSLNSIEIGNNVKRLGERSFMCCYSLKSAKIGSGVLAIQEQTFAGCGKLHSLSLGNSVTSIGEKAFDSCKSLKNVKLPDSLKVIGPGAFWGCSELSSIQIPNGVEGIGSEAFSGCCKLKDVKAPKKFLPLDID